MDRKPQRCDNFPCDYACHRRGVCDYEAHGRNYSQPKKKKTIEERLEAIESFLKEW